VKIGGVGAAMLSHGRASKKIADSGKDNIAVTVVVGHHSVPGEPYGPTRHESIARGHAENAYHCLIVSGMVPVDDKIGSAANP
jgi:hypothetical protein